MIRLGVIGHGARVSSFIKYPMREACPDVRVAGIVDLDREGARARLTEQDRADVVFCESVEQLVREVKPDGLMIGTRCSMHTPFAIEASKYDLPLFLEKPVATSMAQATALEQAFENTRGPVVVSFPLRVSPLCELMRSKIEEGAVGTAEHVLAWNYVPYGHCYFDAFYRDFSVTQGLFLQKATHDLDYLMCLMGGNVTKVAAMGSYGRVFGGSKPAGLTCSTCDEEYTCRESPRNRRRNTSAGGGDHPCPFGEDIGTPETGMNEDSSSALLEFATGAKGVYTQVFYSRRDAAARGAKVSGYHGTLEFDWYTSEMKHVRHHAPFTSVMKGGEGLSHFGGDNQLAENFLEVVQGKARSKTPITTGIQSAYTCLAAKESAETGRFVEVRQVGQSG